VTGCRLAANSALGRAGPQSRFGALST